MHDEARSGRPSLLNDDLVRKVNERVHDDRRFTIFDLSLHFPQISSTLFYDIVSSHLDRRRTHSIRRVYKKNIQELVPRYDKYLNNGGKYAEK